MSCPKCGGTVGPCSDICLDCKYDTAQFTIKDYVICFVIAALLAFGMCYPK